MQRAPPFPLFGKEENAQQSGILEGKTGRVSIQSKLSDPQFHISGKFVHSRVVSHCTIHCVLTEGTSVKYHFFFFGNTKLQLIYFPLIVWATSWTGVVSNWLAGKHFMLAHRFRQLNHNTVHFDTSCGESKVVISAGRVPADVHVCYGWRKGSSQDSHIRETSESRKRKRSWCFPSGPLINPLAGRASQMTAFLVSLARLFFASKGPVEWAPFVRPAAWNRKDWFALWPLWEFGPDPCLSSRISHPS